MQEGSRNAAARRFDNMLSNGIGIERRQCAVPVDDSAIVGADCVHGTSLTESANLESRTLRNL